MCPANCIGENPANPLKSRKTGGGENGMETECKQSNSDVQTNY
jgi:hypothetical protein